MIETGNFLLMKTDAEDVYLDVNERNHILLRKTIY
jgi:hypothetical protein